MKLPASEKRFSRNFVVYFTRIIFHILHRNQIRRQRDALWYSRDIMHKA